MPFDATPDSKLVNRLRLIEALHQPMPEGFAFAYSISYEENTCGTIGCAMGLAKLMGIVRTACTTEMATALGITRQQAYAIFHHAETYGYADLTEADWNKVTPAMVADKLAAL